jgi:heterotetrameric sarcosine oxidase delta subunit
VRIRCPYCGERDLQEFAYLGDATPRRPAGEAPLSDWVDYVYMRENAAGPHREYWYHAMGCRSWLVVSRDTLTHEIAAVRFAAPPTGGSLP